MGHLIWGDEKWEAIRTHYNLPQPTREDPITTTFAALGKCYLVHLPTICCPDWSKGALNSPCHLRHHGDVSTVFADLSNPHRKPVKSYAMSTSKKGCLWSLIRLYPKDSQHDEQCVWFLLYISALRILIGICSDKAKAYIQEEDPDAHAFIKQSTENGVAVGPLEYASNGRVHTVGRRVIV